MMKIIYHVESLNKSRFLGKLWSRYIFWISKNKILLKQYYMRNGIKNALKKRKIR